MSGPYVPIEDLANHFSVSVSTIRGWVRLKHIPEHTYIRVGNTYRYCIDDVVESLSTHALPVTRAEWEKEELDDDGPLEIPHEYNEDEDI